MKRSFLVKDSCLRTVGRSLRQKAKALIMPRGKKDKHNVEGSEAGGGEPSETKAGKKEQKSSTKGEKTKPKRKKNKKGKSSKQSNSSSDDSTYENKRLDGHSQEMDEPLPDLPSHAPGLSTEEEYEKAIAEERYYDRALLLDSKKADTKLRANCSYSAQDSNDLHYNPGDILTVIPGAGTKIGYYYVRQNSNGRRGYIHESRVTRVDVFESEPWFNNFTRDMAEKKLRQGHGSGTYLIRPSKDGPYALSLLADNSVMHYKICIQPNGKFQIEYKGSANKDFDSIPALIRHFTDVRELEVCLKNCYPKEIN